MADYRSNDGCFRHDASRPSCENHSHKVMFAASCKDCAKLVPKHRHDPLMKDHCAICREMYNKVQYD